VDQLARLRRVWAAQGAPLVERLRPGLSMERIDELTRPLGLRLPVEARTWWGWHDGVDVELGIAYELGPSLAFLPLDRAVALCRLARAHAAEVWGDRADEVWRPSWFPLAERTGEIRCDCAVADGDPTPIFWADSHDYDAEGLSTPKAVSLGQMVGWWIEALETGAWEYDHGRGRWVRHRERLPAERRDNLLL
jgi:hypothetical protein